MSPRSCSRCHRPLVEQNTFRLAGASHCLRCALRHGPLLRRSTLTSLVVGTVLVLINQGPEMFAGVLPPALLWKVPLTYAVPFCVATWGALGASRGS